MIDYLTKWAEVFPTADMKGSTVTKIVTEQILCWYGAPEIFTSDQGKQFISGLFKDLMKQCSIEHRPTTAYHPQTDGLVEHFNGKWKRC